MRIPAYLACIGAALVLAACGGEASPPSDAASDMATEEAMATESAMPEATESAMATESAAPEPSASASE